MSITKMLHYNSLMRTINCIHENKVCAKADQIIYASSQTKGLIKVKIFFFCGSYLEKHLKTLISIFCSRMKPDASSSGAELYGGGL